LTDHTVVVLLPVLQTAAAAAGCVFRDDGSQLPDEFWQLKNWSNTLRNKSQCGGRRFFFMADTIPTLSSKNGQKKTL
jgi:hypothetical protein